MYTTPLPVLNSAAHAAYPASAAPNSSSDSPGAELTSTFLLLLTTQLKSQSPLDPLDPNQFVAQLAQFESLGALTQIQQLMQTLVNDVAPNSSSTSNVHSNAQANSTASPDSSSH